MSFFVCCFTKKSRLDKMLIDISFNVQSKIEISNKDSLALTEIKETKETTETKEINENTLFVEIDITKTENQDISDVSDIDIDRECNDISK